MTEIRLYSAKRVRHHLVGMSDPVLVAGIVFSDTVIREQGTGKGSYIGSFHQFTPPTLPFVVPQFFVTALVSNLSIKVGEEIELTVRIQHPSNGHVVFSIGAKVAGLPASLPRAAVIDFSVPIHGLNLQQPGELEAFVLLNGEEIGKRRFSVIAPPTSGHTATPQ